MVGMLEQHTEKMKGEVCLCVCVRACMLVLGSVGSVITFSLSGPGSTLFRPEPLEISGGRAKTSTPPVVDPAQYSTAEADWTP